MSELTFRMKIPNRGSRGENSRPPGPGKPASGSQWLTGATKGTALLWSAIAVIAVYVVRAPRTAVIAGVPVTARDVLVIRDVSGSMEGTKEKLAKQLEQLRQAHIPTSREVRVSGFGVSKTGCRSNLLKTVEAAVGEQPEPVDPRHLAFCDSVEAYFKLQKQVVKPSSLDAVYVFSDFQVVDDPIDGSDPAGYQRLQELLRRHAVRIYLSTVRNAPDEEFVRIANASGGKLIRSQ